jgi:hypothetical protein
LSPSESRQLIGLAEKRTWIVVVMVKVSLPGKEWDRLTPSLLRDRRQARTAHHDQRCASLVGKIDLCTTGDDRQTT